MKSISLITFASFACSSIVCLCNPGQLLAQTIVTDAADATLTEFQNQSANLGGAQQIFLYNEPAGKYRPLIRFNLGSLPVTSVDSAILQLYQLPSEHYAGNPMDIEFYPIARPWVEGTGADHFTPGIGVSWQQSGRGTGWYEPGGDFLFTGDFGYGPNGLVAWTTLTPDGDGSWINVDITSIVNLWLEGSIENNGLGVFIYNGMYSEYQFASSEASGVTPRLALQLNHTDPPSQESLLSKSEFTSRYVGAFRLPHSSSIPGATFGYSGGSGLAVAPDGTLYTMAQLDAGGGSPFLANVSVPPLSLDWTSIGSAQLLSYTDLRGKLETNPVGQTGSSVQIDGNSDTTGIRIDDLIVVGNKIIGSGYVGYDAAGAASHSHFTIDRLDLQNVTDTDVRGLFDIASGLPAGLVGTNGSDAGLIAGYMAEIPHQWRSALGGFSHVTGQAGLNIISRTNAGPAAYLFNAGVVGDSSSTLVEPVAHYPVEAPFPGYQWVDALTQVTPAFNMCTKVEGIFFAPGTRSVLFVGSTAANSQAPDATAQVYYGEANRYLPSDPYQIYSGNHSLGGAYEYQIWAYDVSDFQQVLSGNLAPTAVEPYEVFRFEFPGVPRAISGIREIGGVALDSVTGRLYITQILSDGSPNIVHVYDLGSD